jgi:hypothetical protein
MSHDSNNSKSYLEKKEDGMYMAKNNYVEPNKIALVGWVDKVLDHILIKKNITSKSKDIRIWPLNFKAMDEKNEPN